MKYRELQAASTRARRRALRLEGQIESQTLLDETNSWFQSWLCAAQVRVATGSSNSRLRGCYVQCAKRHRQGKRTCYWHRHMEDV